VGTTGQNTVYPEGMSFTPQYAALLNGAFAHTFDFDDTMAEAVLHPGAAIIPAALAEAESSGATGKRLLLALAVGYEVACRLFACVFRERKSVGFMFWPGVYLGVHIHGS